MSKTTLYLSANSNLQLAIGGNTIPKCREVRYLGVWLDETLSCERQVRAVTRKVMHSLRSITHLRSSLTVPVKLMLTKSLAAVHLDYCAGIFSGLDSSASRQLQVLLNSCVRFITNLPWRSHVTESRRRLGFLTADARRKFLSLVMLYQVARLRWWLPSTWHLPPHFAVVAQPRVIALCFHQCAMACTHDHSVLQWCASGTDCRHL